MPTAGSHHGRERRNRNPSPKHAKVVRSGDSPMQLSKTSPLKRPAAGRRGKSPGTTDERDEISNKRHGEERQRDLSTRQSDAGRVSRKPTHPSGRGKQKLVRDSSGNRQAPDKKAKTKKRGRRRTLSPQRQQKQGASHKTKKATNQTPGKRKATRMGGRKPENATLKAGSHDSPPQKGTTTDDMKQAKGCPSFSDDKQKAVPETPPPIRDDLEFLIQWDDMKALIFFASDGCASQAQTALIENAQKGPKSEDDNQTIVGGQEIELVLNQ